MIAMGSVNELKDAVKDTFERKGLLRQLQAHVRSQVYKVLLDSEVMGQYVAAIKQQGLCISL